MRRAPLAALAVLFLASSSAHVRTIARERIRIDDDWRFHMGDAASPGGDFRFGIRAPFAKAGAGLAVAQVDFDDRDWTPVRLPHDWAVGLPFVNSEDPAVMNRGYKAVGREFPATTIGWYRHVFDIPAEDQGKRIAVQFDGVFRDSIVWINGHYLGRHGSGYTGFTYDLTDYVQFGKQNALTVRVDASYAEGWFYEGAGIYRHVWLLKYAPVHIPIDATFIRSGTDGHVMIQTDVVNDSDSPATIGLIFKIIDEHGQVAGTASSDRFDIAAHDAKRIDQSIMIRNPLLWSVDAPHLYTAATTVESDGAPVDGVETRFGIRSVRFDPDRGFLLNGNRVEIKGVCLHQDHAGVGVALPDRLQSYRIEVLKQFGVNAIRTSHNAPTPELLDACDRLGILVVDENRLMGSSPEVRQDLERLILRDRNHPSVILWSIGNEEWAIQNDATGAAIARTLVQTQHRLDPTRLSTYAADNGDHYDGINSVVDVRGVNYIRRGDIDKYHREHPEQPIIGTEESSERATRGAYADDAAHGFLSDDDVDRVGYRATAEEWWKFYVARPWLAGAFVWSGFDYRGEPSPYTWPNVGSQFGIVDLCGFPKNHAYYYQAWWTDRDVLHLFPHWNWRGKEGQPIDVWCYSNAESVELFLNGKRLGRKVVPQNGHVQWTVPYRPGTLEARARRNGHLLIDRVDTTDTAAAIAMTVDRTRIADNGDVAVVNVSVVDARNRDVPDAGEEIHFAIDGPATIIGVGNGDPASHEADTANHRRLFNGKCQVIVQATGRGKITLHATSDGLVPAVVTLWAADAASTGAYNQ